MSTTAVVGLDSPTRAGSVSAAILPGCIVSSLVDEGAARRLRSRFGGEIEPWLAAAPNVLGELAERWMLEFLGPIPYGSMSVVVGCRTADGRHAVLKLAPDVARLRREIDALMTWTVPHVPEVYALDRAIGALLIEAIEPGTMLRDAEAFPAVERVAALLGGLHDASAHPGAFPPLASFIDHLFTSWDRHRRLHPELVDLVPERLFDERRRLAKRLAAQPAPGVLLHADLTPVKVLDGGDRGLVAIDPAGCIGDAAYDTLDLLAWQVDGLDTLEARAAKLATATGVRLDRVLDWLVAFVAMFALDVAAVDNWDDPVDVGIWRERAAPFLMLASRAQSR